MFVKDLGDFYTVKPKGISGAYRVKESRLFATEEEANRNLKK